MHATSSLLESLASRARTEPEALAREIRRLRPAEALALLHHWPLWARPDQLPPPGAWRVWMILAGRGWGKTRTGAEWVRSYAAAHPGCRIALVARTAADVRDVVVEGESGLLRISPESERPTWEPSRRRLTWPNGSQATTYSADVPDQLRGPQHHAAWCDELASWQYPDTWDQLLFGLRLGDSPRVVVTTTPRPTETVRRILAHPATRVTRGRTRDNAANLARGVVADLERRFGGTRLGRQELDGEVLDDAPGALWKRPWLDAARVERAPDLRRIVVAVDPAVSANATSDETGIVVAGLGYDGRGYVLEDGSGVYSPEAWAARVAYLFGQHRADKVVAEINNGGDLVEANLRALHRNLPVRKIHAKRGKALRAEPVAALYERGQVSHVGALATLEDQLTGWDPATSHDSPDRLDALVYALSELMVSDARPRALPDTSTKPRPHLRTRF
jgi:predicted phage terminase large subunit-like protein